MMAHARAPYTPKPFAFYRQWDGKTRGITYFDALSSLCEATRNNEPVRKVWIEPVANERDLWDVYGESMLDSSKVWLGIAAKED